MRAYWILPNREQADDILACDGETTLPLRQILDPKLRPEGFSHGVPAELLERCELKDITKILFAQQFPDWNGNKQIFSASTPAGLDSSGRIVHLGLLFILEPGERPKFDLPYARLSEQDQSYARTLLHRLNSPPHGDFWAKSARELSELPPGRGPATNVELHRSPFRFHSLYSFGRGQLTSRRRSRANALIAMILFAIVGAWLSVRACARSRPQVQTGVVIWRFN